MNSSNLQISFQPSEIAGNAFQDMDSMQGLQSSADTL